MNRYGTKEEDLHYKKYGFFKHKRKVQVMEKSGMKQEFTGDQAGVTSKATIENPDYVKASQLLGVRPPAEYQVEKKVNGKTRKEVSELSQNEIAEMYFDMVINHRIMELRIEKLETLLSNIPQADSKLSEYMMKAGTVEGRLQKIESRLNRFLTVKLSNKGNISHE